MNNFKCLQSFESLQKNYSKRTSIGDHFDANLQPDIAYKDTQETGPNYID